MIKNSSTNNIEIMGLQFTIKTKKFKQLNPSSNIDNVFDSFPDSNFMFITPSLKFTMNDLHYSYINGDYKKLFTSYSDFTALLNYISTKQKILNKQDTDYETKKKDLLNNNISIIKNIFFPEKTKYLYRKQNFFIGKSIYTNNHYKLSSFTQFKDTDNYKILSIESKNLSSNLEQIYICDLELILIDIPLGSEKPSEKDFQKSSCSQKAEQLEKQFMKYFDVSLNLFERPNQIIIPNDKIIYEK